MTLGILIHRVTGEFYGDFLQQRIFQPLGMQSARIISEADIVPNRAAGYRLVKGELKNQEWVAPVVNTTADGSLYFSILDLAKWDAALYTDKLLKRSSLDLMWTPVHLKNGQAEQRQLRFWLVHRQPSGTPVHSPRRLVAGIRNGYRSLCGRSTHRRRACESSGLGTGEDHAARSRDVPRRQVRDSHHRGH